MKKTLVCLSGALTLNACGPDAHQSPAQVNPMSVAAPAPVVVTPAAPVVIQQDSGVGSALLGAVAGAGLTAVIMSGRNSPAPATNVTHATKNVTVINRTVNVTNTAPAPIATKPETPKEPPPAAPSFKQPNTITPTPQATKIIPTQALRPAIPAPMIVQLPAPTKKK